MAAPFNPPKRAEDFKFGIVLESASSPGTFLTNPTIAAGDFKVSKDFGAWANLTTLPSVAPASGAQVSCELSSTEMTADNVGIKAEDQTVPPEWLPFYLHIPTTA